MRPRNRSWLGWAIGLWVLGLVTVVPYGTYYLLFHATRDEYAALITLVLFWIFGYWGVAGPLLAALKLHAVFRALQYAQARGQLAQALASPDTREAAVSLIASENQVPRFLAAWIYRLLATRLAMSRKGR